MKGVKIMISGAIAGVVSRTVTAPFERLKMLAQVGKAGEEGKRGVLRGIVEMAREEGIEGLFRGNGVACVKAIPSSGIKFLAQEGIKGCVLRMSGRAKMTTGQKLGVGAAAGVISTVLTHPLEILRTRLTVEKPDKATTGAAGKRGGVGGGGTKEAMRRVIEEGSLFAGVVPAIIGSAPFQAVNFAVYELLSEASKASGVVRGIIEKRPTVTAMMPSVYGAISGAVAMTMLYPLDVIKRRMMVAAAPPPPPPQERATSGKGRKKATMIGTTRELVEKEGVKGLYRGMWPAFFKVVPTVSVNWLTFEICKKVLSVH